MSKHNSFFLQIPVSKSLGVVKYLFDVSEDSWGPFGGVHGPVEALLPVVLGQGLQVGLENFQPLLERLGVVVAPLHQGITGHIVTPADPGFITRLKNAPFAF